MPVKSSVRSLGVTGVRRRRRLLNASQRSAKCCALSTRPHQQKNRCARALQYNILIRNMPWFSLCFFNTYSYLLQKLHRSSVFHPRKSVRVFTSGPADIVPVPVHACSFIISAILCYACFVFPVQVEHYEPKDDLYRAIAVGSVVLVCSGAVSHEWIGQHEVRRAARAVDAQYSMCLSALNTCVA